MEIATHCTSFTTFVLYTYIIVDNQLLPGVVLFDYMLSCIQSLLLFLYIAFYNYPKVLEHLSVSIHIINIPKYCNMLLWSLLLLAGELPYQYEWLKLYISSMIITFIQVVLFIKFTKKQPHPPNKHVPLIDTPTYIEVTSNIPV